MSDQIKQQGKTDAERKSAEHPPNQRLGARQPLERIKTAYTICYVVGPLVFGAGIGILFTPGAFIAAAIVIMLGIVITGAGIVLHVRSTLHSERQETLSLNLGETPPLPDEFPELALDLKFGDFEIGKPMGMQFQLHNVGSATAHNFGMQVSYKTFDVRPDSILVHFPYILEYGKPDYDNYRMTKIPMGDKKYTHPVIELSPKLTPALLNGDVTLFVFGIFWYEDRFKNRTTERYCRVFNPKTPEDPFNAPHKITAAMVEEISDGSGMVSGAELHYQALRAYIGVSAIGIYSTATEESGFPADGNFHVDVWVVNKGKTPAENFGHVFRGGFVSPEPKNRIELPDFDPIPRDRMVGQILQDQVSPIRGDDVECPPEVTKRVLSGELLFVVSTKFVYTTLGREETFIVHHIWERRTNTFSERRDWPPLED